MIKILVAEDDHAIRELIAVYLKHNGYDVYLADNGRQAYAMLQTTSMDLVITDVMMPYIDGFQLAHQIRKQHPQMPIIILTALDQIHDKERGFQSGVDDYMVKPVELKELGLRIKALLRRYQIQSEQKITLGQTILDSRSYSCQVNDQIINLTRKEFELLHKLLSYPNVIFTRNQLMDEIWGFDSDSYDRTIDTHIKRIREQVPEQDFEIITVRGLGYKAVIK